MIHFGGKHVYHWFVPNFANQIENLRMKRPLSLNYFVLSGEAVGYDIEATLNMPGSCENVSRIAVGQDAPNQETHVP